MASFTRGHGVYLCSNLMITKRFMYKNYGQFCRIRSSHRVSILIHFYEQYKIKIILVYGIIMDNHNMC